MIFQRILKRHTGGEKKWKTKTNISTSLFDPGNNLVLFAADNVL